MGLTSTTFIAGKMNKSVDERLVPPGEYVDALNVRLGSTEDTEIGAVENSKGNSRLTTLEYGGQPLNTVGYGDVKTIGCFEDGINETIYWFIHQTDNPNSVVTGVIDMVVSFNTQSATLIYHVISTQVLNFSFNNLITGVSKVDDLLFFTDDLNPPRFINVNRDYPYPVGDLDTILEEEDISVIVKPPGFEDYSTTSPLGTPHIELINIPGEENYMDIRFLSFAYRYRYEDGQYSATSLFSTPSFEPGQFSLSSSNVWNEGMENMFNACNVTFSTGSKRVIQVDLLYKESTTNVINVINRYVKKDEGWPDNSFKTKQFSNSEIYTILGQDELFRLYDNVPRVAKAQSIQGNRLMYGNYVDGYDIKSVEDGLDIKMTYEATPFIIFNPLEPIDTNTVLTAGTYPIGQSIITAPSASPHVEQNSVLTFDMSGVASSSGSINVGTEITLNFTIQQTTPTFALNDAGSFTPSIQSSPFLIGITFVCPTTYSSVSDMLDSQVFKNKFGGSLGQGYTSNGIVKPLYPCNESANGSTLSDRLYSQATSPLPGTSLVLVSGGINNTEVSDISNQAILDSSPFPFVCGSTQLVNSTTTGSVPAPSPGLGTLVDDNVDFFSSAVEVGYYVIVSSIGLMAQVTDVSQNILTIVDVNGGLPILVNSGTNYIITPGGGNTPFFNPNGFQYNHTTGTDTFSIQVPATRWFGANGLQEGVTENAVRYYNFIAEGCIVSKRNVVGKSSLHSNRDYEVGIVYMDEYGRASTVLTSLDSTVFFNAGTSSYKNQIKVTLDNLPPYWAKKYKFVVKPGQGAYETIYSRRFYRQDGTGDGTTSLPIANTNDPGLTWFKLEGQNQNVLKTGDELIVKRDSNGAVNSEQKAVVLDIQYFSSDGISTVQNSEVGLYMLLRAQGWSAQENIIESLGLTQSWENEINLLGITNVFPFDISPVTDGDYCALCNGDWGSISDYSSNFNSITSGTIFNGVTGMGYPLHANGVNIPIPQGAEVEIYYKINRASSGDACRKKLKYRRTFISSFSYPNFSAWAIGDDLAGQMLTTSTNDAIGTDANEGNMTFTFDNSLFEPIGPLTNGTVQIESYDNSGSGFWDSWYTQAACFNTDGGQGNAFARIATTQGGLQHFVLNGMLDECSQGIGVGTISLNPQTAHAQMSIKITERNQQFVFETIPGNVDGELFYDASELLEIEPQAPGLQPFHKAGRTFDPTSQVFLPQALSQDQNQTSPMITILDFYNCYAFGNGVESYKIYDSPAGKGFNLGERVLAVSNQQFKEADRYASITYSGIYNNQSNVNNLNEFNLGLLNFKDCNQEFGPIQVLHPRESNLLTLQEDRITYVMNDKNILSDAVGGGAIVSIPQVLGEQVVRIEEYGISFNPESFATFGSDMYFTDTKRGAVLNLRSTGKGDALQVISDFGMNSWFRDSFNIQLNTQKLGGYDPYMNEYVLGTNLTLRPLQLDKVPCGTRSSFNEQLTTVLYEVDLGLVIGTINIPYIVTSGSIAISISWNGSEVASIPASSSSGTLTFNKTSNAPSVCTVLITPNTTSTFELTVGCPPEKNIEVIQVVVSSNNDAGKYIHTDYSWSDGLNTSPFTGFSSAGLTVAQPSEYDSAIGVRSIGVFPYSGTDITLRTRKFGIDDFNFNPLLHKFKILSSNTEYTSSIADIDSLLIASSTVSPISEPQPNVFQATELSFNLPDSNNYLYIIWDLRQTSSQVVCFCNASHTVNDVCCNCVVRCKDILIGPRSLSAEGACTTDVDSPQVGNNQVSFNGDFSLPTVGDVVYSTTSCSLPNITAGFYIVSQVSPSIPPKKWIEIGNAGQVINEGNC